jgi:hypothetical protein
MISNSMVLLSNRAVRHPSWKRVLGTVSLLSMVLLTAPAWSQCTSCGQSGGSSGLAFTLQVMEASGTLMTSPSGRVDVTLIGDGGPNSARVTTSSEATAISLTAGGIRQARLNADVARGPGSRLRLTPQFDVAIPSTARLAYHFDLGTSTIKTHSVGWRLVGQTEWHRSPWADLTGSQAAQALEVCVSAIGPFAEAHEAGWAAHPELSPGTLQTTSAAPTASVLADPAVRFTISLGHTATGEECGWLSARGALADLDTPGAWQLCGAPAEPTVHEVRATVAGQNSLRQLWTPRAWVDVISTGTGASRSLSLSIYPRDLTVAPVNGLLVPSTPARYAYTISQVPGTTATEVRRLVTTWESGVPKDSRTLVCDRPSADQCSWTVFAAGDDSLVRRTATRYPVIAPYTKPRLGITRQKLARAVSATAPEVPISPPTVERDPPASACSDHVSPPCSSDDESTACGQDENGNEEEDEDEPPPRWTGGNETEPDPDPLEPPQPPPSTETEPNVSYTYSTQRPAMVDPFPGQPGDPNLSGNQVALDFASELGSTRPNWSVTSSRRTGRWNAVRSYVGTIGLNHYSVEETLTPYANQSPTPDTTNPTYSVTWWNKVRCRHTKTRRIDLVIGASNTGVETLSVPQLEVESIPSQSGSTWTKVTRSKSSYRYFLSNDPNATSGSSNSTERKFIIQERRDWFGSGPNDFYRTVFVYYNHEYSLIGVVRDLQLHHVTRCDGVTFNYTYSADIGAPVVESIVP